MYDFLITSCVYYSVDKSLDLAKSLKYLPGRNLIIFTGCRQEDVQELNKELQELDIEYAVFDSDINNSRFCINWGFICSVMMELKAKWYISCDDDIEFWEAAKDIPQRLDRAKEMGFSIMAFRNPNQTYGGQGANMQEGYQIAPGWLDGNAMFFDYEDVLKYGLTDSIIDDPITFFVEMELEHRYRILTGKPLMVDLSQNYYLHHFRDDPEMAKVRNWNAVRGMCAGSELWIKKYGFNPGDWNHDGCHQRIFAHVSQPEQLSNMKRHIMYDNRWTNDWPGIIRFAADKVKLVGENIKWE
jgi:hypothetical protein